MTEAKNVVIEISDYAAELTAYRLENTVELLRELIEYTDSQVLQVVIQTAAQTVDTVRADFDNWIHEPEGCS